MDALPGLTRATIPTRQDDWIHHLTIPRQLRLVGGKRALSDTDCGVGGLGQELTSR